jgi:arylsulfatase A-like enzyme/Flp pilus assembly protein TadD
VGVGAAAWWAAGHRAFDLRPDEQQNVLLVTIDSLRADALSIDGGGAATPSLDALARRGVRFTYAHTHAVSTLAAHTTLLTGRLPFEHGVRDDRGYRLAPDGATMAGRLKTAGFATGAFVGSALVGRRRGLEGGFDVYDDRADAGAGAIDLTVAQRSADRVIRPALNWIGQQPGRWFAWVHLFEPHAPYAPPVEIAGRYPSDPYLAEVAAADAALAALFDRLDQESRPTLVIVTADHGEGRGQHGEETHGLFAYESTLRVPLIVAQVEPGTEPPAQGADVDQSARLIDVLPTVLEAVGMAADPNLPGSTLRELLAGRAVERPVYFEALSANVMRGWAPLRGVISGRRKYIDLPVPELYDLASDPEEQRNIASVDASSLALMRTALEAFDLAPPAAPADASAEVFERLRSLGYASSGRRPVDRFTEADDPKRLVEYDRVMDAATLAFEQARYEDAATALQQVIIERPGNAEAYLSLAVVFWHGGLPDQAIATLRAALTAGLPQGGIRVTLADMLSRTAGAQRAVRLLEDQTGDDLAALSALGIAYSQTNRPADAERAFQRMLEIDPSSGLAYQNLGILRLRQGRPADAEAALRRAIGFEPTLSSAHTPLGVALSEQGRLDEAIEAWTEAVGIDPGEYFALFNLTVALGARGRVDDARRAGTQFLQTAPPALYGDQLVQIRNLLAGR